LTQLRRLGVQVFVTPRGGVKGRFLITPQGFVGGDIAGLEAEHALEAIDSQSLAFFEPSPFAAMGPIDFAGARDHDELEARLRRRWEAWWDQQQGALHRARELTPDAGFCSDPWRIEADLTHRFERVRVLFAADGRKAVIVGVGGRAVSLPPAEPRIIIAVDPPLDRVSHDDVMDRAIEQANRYAPQADDLAGATALSVDLATSDLAAR
jgi:hypothetical protein